MLVDCSDALLKGNAGVVMTTLFCHLKDHPELLVEGEFQTLIQQNVEEHQDFFSSFVEACSSAMGDDMVEQHFFHLYYMKGIIYACIGDDTEIRDQKVNFAFLGMIHKEFTRLHNARKIRKANAYAMEATFKPNMRSSMHHYNVNHDDIAKEEKVKKMEAQVQNLKNVMGRNIDLLMERGEHFESILERSDDLENQAQVFRKRSKIVKRYYKHKHYRQLAVYTGIIVVIVGFIAFLSFVRVCGIDLSKCKAHD